MEATVFKALSTLLKMEPFWFFIAALMVFAYKKIKDKFYVSRVRRTETLEKLVSYLEKPHGEQSLLLREMLFEDHFGRALSWDEISYFKNRPEALRLLNKYLLAVPFVLACNKSGKIYQRNNVNIVRKNREGIILYVVFGMLTALLLLGASEAFQVSGPEVYAPWVIVTLSSAVLAGLYLHQWLATDAALELLKRNRVAEGTLSPTPTVPCTDASNQNLQTENSIRNGEA